MRFPLKPPVRVGLVGAGLIGQTHSLMLKVIDGCAEGSVRIAAIYDPIREQAERVASYWPGAKVAKSAQAVLEDEHIDAVWVCTPTRFHRETCVEAARAGKHLFCEKPLAMNADEAAEIEAAVNAAGVLAQVGLVLRFSAVYNVMRSMIAEPDAGKLLAVTMRDDQDFPVRGAHASSWRNDPAQTAGGTLIEHGVHDFDLLTWMFGPVERVYCRTKNLSGAAGVEDFGAVHLEFASGLHGQMTSVWHRMIGRPSNRRLEVFAENLSVATDHDMVGPLIVQRGEGSEEVISGDIVTQRFTKMTLGRLPYLDFIRQHLALPYLVEDAVFLGALCGRGRPDPPIAAGVAAQRLVEKAYQSARQGSVVAVEG
jgi:myo-inositol 2-dehydrogenase / D-chiro-inositol 1-dehydrogenase